MARLFSANKPSMGKEAFEFSLKTLQQTQNSAEYKIQSNGTALHTFWRMFFGIAIFLKENINRFEFSFICL